MAKISFEDRLRISQLLNLGRSIRQIAAALGRSPSSISQEVRRQGQDKNTYNPYIAQEHANIRKAASRKNKKIQGVLEEIIDLLLIELHFSPEQICGYLKKHYPSDKSFHVCPETIYKHVYESRKSKIYISILRRRRKRRGLKKSARSRRSKIPNLVSIEQRPSEVQERNEIGHWEGDLIIGKQHKTALGTLVERSTRYTIIVPFIDAKDSQTVAREFSKALQDIPSFLKKSLTYDQGSEMCHHELFSASTGMNVYFAHAGCPWERGTNENANGLIRNFFPKGCDFRKIPYEEFAKVEKLLNKRPRKILKFNTPDQMLRLAILNPGMKLKEVLSTT